jgi:hypothetical protein
MQQNSFNPTPEHLAILIVWHLMKVITRLEVIPSVTSSMRTDSMTLSWANWNPTSYHNGFKRSNMCKQVSAGKTKHATLMILQELYVIGRLNSGENRREIMASHIKTVNYLGHTEMEKPITSVHGIMCKYKGRFQVTNIERAKISAIGQVVYVVHTKVL